MYFFLYFPEINVGRITNAQTIRNEDPAERIEETSGERKYLNMV
jgi:hypothetical protein